MKFLKIGQIVNVHGIKGEVKVYPYTDDILSFAQYKCIYIDENTNSKMNIIKSRIQKNMLILKFENVDTVEQAESFRGKYIYVLKEELKKLEEDCYYVDDLISMDVIDVNTGNILGKLVYVFNTGANDVYEIETESKDKIYLPAIKQVIKKVDIQENKIYVEVMEGLI